MLPSACGGDPQPSRQVAQCRAGAGAAGLVVTLAVAAAGCSGASARAGSSIPTASRFYRIALDMIAARPWLGTGLGSFDAAFPAWRSEALGMFGIWEQAHSSPLELAVEMGIPVTVVVLAAWLAVMRRLWMRAWQSRGGSLQTGFACVALLGTLHSCIDFSLQLPGFAAFFAAICGLGAGFGSGAGQPQLRQT